MRIAYVVADPGVPVFGCKGCSIHVQEVVRALVRLGHHVTLLARRWGGEAPADLAGVQCVELPRVSGSAGAQRELELAASNRSLPRLLDDHGPFDMLYERYSLWSCAALQWGESQGVRTVLEVNAPLVEEQARHRELHHREMAEAISSKALLAAWRIVAVSTGVGRWLGGQGVAPAKVEIIPNGVDTERFAPAFDSRNPVPVVGFVGTLKPWHGLVHLIEAAALLEQRCRGGGFELLIVGDGPERPVVESALAESGLAGRSRLTGAVDPSEIPGLLTRMDIAVAPYPDLADFYFSPLKVMEYMAAGRAVVASRIGDIDGLIEQDVTGCLCPPGDAGALARALERLIEDPSLRARLGRAAREHAVERLGWTSVVRRILSLQGEHAPC